LQDWSVAPLRGYQQISRDERVRIAHMLEERASLRRIARRLGREPSTLSRELKRNRNADGGYRAVSAQQRAGRRPRGHPRPARQVAPDADRGQRQRVRPVAGAA
jgi:IS30 family transposase